MRLLNPEIQAIQENIKTHKLSKNQKSMILERQRLDDLYEKYQIKTTYFSKINMILQGSIFIIWASLIQRFTMKIQDYPEMLTGGFLWFKDLSMNDPYFILPLINSVANFFIIYVSFFNLV